MPCHRKFTFRVFAAIRCGDSFLSGKVEEKAAFFFFYAVGKKQEEKTGVFFLHACCMRVNKKRAVLSAKSKSRFQSRTEHDRGHCTQEIHGRTAYRYLACFPLKVRKNPAGFTGNRPDTWSKEKRYMFSLPKQRRFCLVISIIAGLAQKTSAER